MSCHLCLAGGVDTLFDMKKLSAVAVSTVLAMTLFSPVGCFAQQQQASSDCCGCAGDHGTWVCVDGECIDDSKQRSPSSSSSDPTGTSSDGTGSDTGTTNDAGAKKSPVYPPTSEAGSDDAPVPPLGDI